MVDECFPDAQQILDFFHLSENVHEYARYYFGADESMYRPWAKSVCDKLRKSRYSEVLRELEKHSKTKEDKSPLNLFGYITTNIRNIDYAAYEQKGYFIGSGAVESGNKTVLQQRLNRCCQTKKR